MEIISGHNVKMEMLPYEDYINLIKSFKLIPALRYMQEASLMFADRLLLKEEIEDYRTPPTKGLFTYITRDAHAFIAKSIIRYSPLNDGDELTRNDYKWLNVCFYELITDLNFINPKEKDSYKYVIRVENSQFRYWHVYGDIMGRYIIMFELPEADEINRICKEELGLSFLECITICLSIFADIQSRRKINIQMLANHTIDNEFLKSCLTEEKILRFCEIFSTTIDEFRQRSIAFEANDAKYPLQKYEFNPLYSFPIIKVEEKVNNGESLIIPSIPDLIYSSCEGVYYKLMDKFQMADKKNDFSGRFGKIFESYFYHLLKNAKIDYFDESDVNENPMKLDALLIHENGRVHIEVKKNKMSVFARACIGNEMEKFIDRLANENIYGQLYKKRRENSINIIICMDELFGFEDKIKPEIESKLKSKKDYDDNFKFHLLGIRDLEFLMQFHITKKVSLLDFFRYKEENAYYKSVSNTIAEDYNYDPKGGFTLLQNRYMTFYSSLYSKK